MYCVESKIHKNQNIWLGKILKSSYLIAFWEFRFQLQKKNVLIDSSHLFKKARDAIFIQKQKLQDICWFIFTLLFYVLDSILQYFQTILSNLAFYLHIFIEMTSPPMEKSKLPPQGDISHIKIRRKPFYLLACERKDLKMLF